MPASEITVLIVVSCSVLMLLAVFIVSFIWVFNERQKSFLREKESLAIRYQQEILQAQLEIQHQTLQYFSGEIHDNVGQLLSVARVYLNMLETEATGFSRQIGETNEVIASAISELRALSKSLDGDFVKDFGLIESLAHELQRVRRTGQYETRLDISGTPCRLEPQRELVVFRVIQELINNAIKHADARRISVYADFADSGPLAIVVSDDGKGFEYAPREHNTLKESGAGLRSIRRRMELIGGTCSFESGAEKGTKATITLPMDNR